MVAFSRFSLEPEGVSHDYPTCLQHISLWVAAMLISSLTRFAFGFHLRPLFGHGGRRLPPHCMTPSPARLCFVHKKGHGRRVQFVAAKLLTALLPPPSLKVLVLGHGRFAPHVSMSLMLMSCADVPASVSRGRMLRPGDCSRCNRLLTFSQSPILTCTPPLLAIHAKKPRPKASKAGRPPPLGRHLCRSVSANAFLFNALQQRNRIIMGFKFAPKTAIACHEKL